MYTEWQRPKTTRLYVHPPKSERFYTLWREGKLIFGETRQPITEYEAQTSAGLWFTDDRGRAFAYHKGSLSVREDGIPVHAVTHRMKSRLLVTVETFATHGRRSVCYAKLTVKNPTEMAIESKVGFLLRTAAEKALVFESPDLYASYAPELAEWQALTPTWRATKGGYTDGTRFIGCESDMAFAFDEASGAAMADFKLSAGESASAVFAYDVGNMPSPRYEEDRAAAIGLWERELARINALPARRASISPLCFSLRAITAATT